MAKAFDAKTGMVYDDESGASLEDHRAVEAMWRSRDSEGLQRALKVPGLKQQAARKLALMGSQLPQGGFGANYNNIHKRLMNTGQQQMANGQTPQGFQSTGEGTYNQSQLGGLRDSIWQGEAEIMQALQNPNLPPGERQKLMNALRQNQGAIQDTHRGQQDMFPGIQEVAGQQQGLSQGQPDVQMNAAGHLFGPGAQQGGLQQGQQEQSLGSNELELRARLDSTSNPIERAKLEDQIRTGRPGLASTESSRLAQVVPGFAEKEAQVAMRIKSENAPKALNPFLASGIGNLTEDTIRDLTLFDSNKESHRNLMKTIIQEKIDSGKPVDPDKLKEEVGKRLRAMRNQDVGDKKLLADEKKIDSKLSGEPAHEGYGKKAINQIETGILAANDVISATEGLMNDFDPSFFNWWSQKGMDFDSMKERFLNQELDPADALQMQKFTTFRMGVTEMFNKYRKDVTGAAASDQELVRLEKAFVNMNMSETQFKAGMKALKHNAQIKRLLLIKSRKDGPLKHDVDAIKSRARAGKGIDNIEKEIGKHLKVWDEFNENILSKNGSKWDKLQRGTIDKDGKVTLPGARNSGGDLTPEKASELAALPEYANDPDIIEVQEALKKQGLTGAGEAPNLTPKDPLGQGPLSAPMPDDTAEETKQNLGDLNIRPSLAGEMINRKR